MRAMVLDTIGPVTADSTPLRATDCPDPEPGDGEIVLRVLACGVCHTELDEIEGRLPVPELPVIPGHEVVGEVAAAAAGVDAGVGRRFGVAWIHSACGECEWCRSGRENLCPEFRGTGCDANGGYAQYMRVPAAFAIPFPDGLDPCQGAPFLCAGAVGYRALRLTGIGDGAGLGLTGFGASGHLVLQAARYRYPRAEVYVFARNPAERELALELGAVWAGDTTERPGVALDAIIDTTPVWLPVIEALDCLKPAGRLVINAIRKEDVDQHQLATRLSYHRHLWREKEIHTVANVTRRDVREFLELAAGAGLTPEVSTYELEQANQALVEIKTGRARGAKVLAIA